MQKLLLSQDAVDKLEATSLQSVFYDSELTGFGLAVSQGGAKTWIVWRRSGKSRQRLTRISLGAMAEMTANEARETARRVLATSKATQATGRQERERTPTVGQFAQDFMERHVRPKLRPEAAKVYAYHFQRVIIPLIGSLKIDRVTSAHLARLRVGREGTANLTLGIVSSMYTFAARQWRVPQGFNPARGMSRSKRNARAA